MMISPTRLFGGLAGWLLALVLSGAVFVPALAQESDTKGDTGQSDATEVELAPPEKPAANTADNEEHAEAREPGDTGTQQPGQPAPAQPGEGTVPAPVEGTGSGTDATKVETAPVVEPPPVDGERLEDGADPASNVVDSDATDPDAPVNAADSAAPGGATGGEGIDPLDQVRTTSPVTGDQESGGDEFKLSPEELQQLMGTPLPSFAEDQPGFIPDTEPSDLFVEEPQELVLMFESALGDSKLPPGSSSGIVRSHDADIKAGLADNFARMVVPNGKITGSTETKQFHIDGGVSGIIIYYNQVTISGYMADVDEKNELAVISGSVIVDDPEYIMRTEELRIYFEEKKFQAKGFVQFEKKLDPLKSEPNLDLPKKDRLREYFAGQRFELYCKDLFYDWDAKTMVAIGSVRMNHPIFNGTMDRVDYNDKTKEYEISGKVILDITKYDWIFENKLLDEDDEQKAQALTTGNTNIECDRLVYKEETGVAEFYSRRNQEVTFKQVGRTITGNYIEVNDETKDFYVEGSEERKAVYNQTDGEWLFTGGLVNEDTVSEDLSDALRGRLEAQAETIAYNFDRKRMELLGGVVITAGEKTIEAGEVVHDETAKYFLMRDNVLIKPDRENEMRAAQVYLDTENDVFTFVGLVSGILHSNDLPTNEDAGTPPGEEIEVAAGLTQQDISASRGASDANGNVADSSHRDNVAGDG